MLTLHAGFGWGGGNFLHSSWYGAVFWICAETRVGNTGLVELLLSGAYTEPRPSLLLTRRRAGWGCAGSRDPRCPQGPAMPHGVVLSAPSWRKKKEGGHVWSGGVCLPKSPLGVTEPGSPGDG